MLSKLKIIKKIKWLIPLDNPLRIFYHFVRAVIANVIYGFPSKDMLIIWVTWTNWKTTTSNIIAKWLKEIWKKVFMFSTVNIILGDKEYINYSKMTSPDVFELQRLLKIAKKEWCEIAVIETASHGIKMYRTWWLNYDIAVLTNISRDHLDLHKTMNDYVNTKLKLFKNLISSKRKPWVKKMAVINIESDYSDLFLSETFDSIYTYWNWKNASIIANEVKHNINWMAFNVNLIWTTIKIETLLRWYFNVENILASIWVFIALWIKENKICEIIKNIKWIPGRMEEVDNSNWFKIIIDYAHTPDALEKVLYNMNQIEWKNRIITVFWATWDRDKIKRPIMWEIASRLSDIVILTQDDDYSEKTEDIIKDVLPWIERKESEDFWIITNREDAIRTALLSALTNDIVLIAWKWDEHTMVTNDWNILWHDKDVVEKILKWMNNNKIIIKK